MRYFIALDFDSETRDQFYGYATTLKTHADKARIVNRNHIHLTLSFLGALGPDKVKKAKEIVKGIEQSPFTLRFENMSYFKVAKGRRIVWIGPRNSYTLQTLHRQLNESLYEAGFSLETRMFTPHVTLARDVRITPESFTDFKEVSRSFNVKVLSISLMRSSFQDGKLEHTKVVTQHFSG